MNKCMFISTTGQTNDNEIKICVCICTCMHACVRAYMHVCVCMHMFVSVRKIVNMNMDDCIYIENIALVP